ncbi:hypothetical protein [Lacrimispora sp. JR3]|uniref:hypothetical protein n=1 Tax=Lacrimispora sinapis TaxID=3111456 RepID=UPI0037481E61
MDVFHKVLNSCLTETQIEILRQALKAKAKVYFYGRGLGKSLLAETLKNAGYDADEPGTRLDALGPMDVQDAPNTIAFCVKNTPKETIKDVFDILLGCKNEIVEWVNL